MKKVTQTLNPLIYTRRQQFDASAEFRISNSVGSNNTSAAALKIMHVEIKKSNKAI